MVISIKMGLGLGWGDVGWRLAVVCSHCSGSRKDGWESFGGRSKVLKTSKAPKWLNVMRLEYTDVESEIYVQSRVTPPSTVDQGISGRDSSYQDPVIW